MQKFTSIQLADTFPFLCAGNIFNRDKSVLTSKCIRTLYQTVAVFSEDRALQVAVRSSPLSMSSESLGTTTAGSKSEHNEHGQNTGTQGCDERVQLEVSFMCVYSLSF